MVRVNTQQIRTTKQLVRFWRARFQHAKINQVAASLAYTTILAVVPMFSIATMLISKLPKFWHFRMSIQNWIADTLIPGALSDKVSAYMLNFSSHSMGLTTFGVIGLLVTAFVTLMTIERSFNHVWQVKVSRPFFKRLIIYSLITLLGPILLGASVYFSSILMHVDFGLHLNFKSHLDVLDFLLPFVVSSLPFMILYKFGPSAQVTYKDALLGGLLAGIAFEIAKYGFTIFISKTPVYNTLYGAFAIGPLFLLWIYVTWWVTLAGAVLTASLPHIRANSWFTEA